MYKYGIHLRARIIESKPERLGCTISRETLSPLSSHWLLLSHLISASAPRKPSHSPPLFSSLRNFLSNAWLASASWSVFLRAGGRSLFFTVLLCSQGLTGNVGWREEAAWSWWWHTEFGHHCPGWWLCAALTVENARATLWHKGCRHFRRRPAHNLSILKIRTLLTSSTHPCSQDESNFSSVMNA